MRPDESSTVRQMQAGWTQYEPKVITLLTEIRDRLPAAQPPDGAAALGVVQSVAKELEAAAVALDQAAAQLREDGKGYRAAHAKDAAKRAHSAARDLIDG